MINYNLSSNNGFPKGTVSPLVGVLGAKPLRRPPQRAKYLIVLNGARGEKCDSISRGSEQDRFPLLQLHNKLTSKTCQWHAFDTLRFKRYTKAVASLLLERFSLAESLPFEAIASKFPLQSASKHACGRRKRFALCGGRQWGVAPLTPTKGCAHPLETRGLYTKLLSNSS